MCHFVPGEVIAIGPICALQNIATTGLPGILSDVTPLVSQVGVVGPGSPFDGLGSVVLKTEPGLELYALSRLSTRLQVNIECGEAVVDLNHILPFGSAVNTAFTPLRLSPYAHTEASGLRRFLHSVLAEKAMCVAVLDSGIAPEYEAHRDLHFLDYSSAGRLNLDSPRSDPRGHGTRVVTILDQILPKMVGVSVGRLPSQDNFLTALTISHAFADIVARERPEVVNLSVSIRSDLFICPSCGNSVGFSGFLSSLLPFVIRLGGQNAARTVTVMAAGNSGQIPNSRWLTDEIDTLIIAVAENKHRHRAKYSSAPEGLMQDRFSASAFGGDDDKDFGAQGVFEDGFSGTSFAAPFISAAALAAKSSADPAAPLGLATRQIIDKARLGRIENALPPWGRSVADGY